MAQPVVLIGTGTSVGKTYVAERLLHALGGRGLRAVGYKPVESGYSDPSSSDIHKLERASSFHVKPSLRSWTYAAPVSPHLAARREGTRVPLDAIEAEIARGVASAADVLLVELAGGAFSPFGDGVCCAELARTIHRATVLLVASDRLGVLHDIGATTRACAGLGLPLLGIVLSAPAVPDDSTAHNSVECPSVTSTPVLAALPRTSEDAGVSRTDAIQAVADAVLANAR